MKKFKASIEITSIDITVNSKIKKSSVPTKSFNYNIVSLICELIVVLSQTKPNGLFEISFSVDPTADIKLDLRATQVIKTAIKLANKVLIINYFSRLHKLQIPISAESRILC
jgi:hypothetical protein